MKRLQDTETSPVTYDTAPGITMTWMTENHHQQSDSTYTNGTNGSHDRARQSTQVDYSESPPLYSAEGGHFNCAPSERIRSRMSANCSVQNIMGTAQVAYTFP